MGQWSKAAGREIQVGNKKSIPDEEKNSALEHTAQRSGGNSILEAILEHPEQPDLALKLALLPNLSFLCFCEFQVTSSEA